MLAERDGAARANLSNLWLLEGILWAIVQSRKNKNLKSISTLRPLEVVDHHPPPVSTADCTKMAQPEIQTTPDLRGLSFVYSN